MMSFPRRLAKVGLCVALCLVLSAVLGFALAPKLLSVESEEPKGEVIVLLGGEVTHRVTKATELYKQGVAPAVLMCCRGECDLMQAGLEAAGVPASAIYQEVESTNTEQNARYAVRWLREHKVHSAVIVTSWFHSRRALACFRKYGDGMHFESAPCYGASRMRGEPGFSDIRFVGVEYVKTGWYVCRYGIIPGWQAGN